MAAPARALQAEDPDRVTPFANRVEYTMYGQMPASYRLPPGKGGVILFDGVCNFCNAWVQFVVQHDPERRFAFASMQSDVGKGLLKNCGRQEDDLSSIILIDKDGYHSESTAVLRIVQRLKPGVRGA